MGDITPVGIKQFQQFYRLYNAGDRTFWSGTPAGTIGKSVPIVGYCWFVGETFLSCEAFVSLARIRFKYSLCVCSSISARWVKPVF